MHPNKTPLTIAKENGFSDIIEVLISAGGSE
jgi:hypothetical protein